MWGTKTYHFHDLWILTPGEPLFIVFIGLNIPKYFKKKYGNLFENITFTNSESGNLIVLETTCTYFHFSYFVYVIVSCFLLKMLLCLLFYFVLEVSKTSFFIDFGKRQAPGNDANWLNKILKIMEMRSIAIKKTWNGNLVNLTNFFIFK